MAITQRGEIDALIGGEMKVLCLTLGALAELESRLQAGDLVFFRIRGGMHVGFYDTEHNFLHASSSQGVMRSSLDNPYWNSVFYQARRLPKEYNAQITMNSDHQHLAKNH